MQGVKSFLTESRTLLESLSQRLPTSLKWITHGKMRYLVLCEALFLSWFYLYDRASLITGWKLLTFEIGSVLLLAILEHRTGLPLPFMEYDFDRSELFMLFGAALALTFGVSCGIPLICWYMQTGSLLLLSFPSIMFAMNAGITEESSKVALTNIFTAALRRMPIVKKSKLLSKVALCIVGSGSVAFWAWLHIVIRGDSTGFGVMAFIVGMVYLGLVIMCKNYLPTVFAHAFFDWMAPC